jgi:hypothetical protein
MGDFLSILWTIFSFIFGILWSIVWFILSDLISTLMWIGIAVWIGFVLRYRSFALGSLSMLRYARYAAVWGWRWLRGGSGPADSVMRTPAAPVTKVVKEYHKKIPLGYISVSEQINVLLIGLLVVMANV